MHILGIALIAAIVELIRRVIDDTFDKLETK